MTNQNNPSAVFPPETIIHPTNNNIQLAYNNTFTKTRDSAQRAIDKAL